jgi:hypothetical protein
MKKVEINFAKDRPTKFNPTRVEFLLAVYLCELFFSTLETQE